MAETNVSSSVMSIVASFSNGLDVFKKLRETRRRRKRSKTNDKAGAEEVRLTRSLRRGPEDIGREYQRSFQTAGDQFAVGDAIAQTSLAECLLKLNTGLVSIITSFLNRDTKGGQLDYQSLTSLSEQTRIDTCRTLRQLCRRMFRSRPSPAADSRLTLQSSEQLASDGASPPKNKRSRRRPVAPPPKIRGPTIARLVVQNSSKPSQVVLAKPGERRAKSSSSSPSPRVDPSPQTATITPISSPPPYDSPGIPVRPPAQRSQTVPEGPRARRMYSAATMRSPLAPAESEALRPTKSTPHLRVSTQDQNRSALSTPNTAPMSTVAPRRRAKPTRTHYSMASTSTKLGEIPLHKWVVPFDFDEMSLINKEAERNRWPANQWEVRKRRFGLFRLFRRKESAE